MNPSSIQIFSTMLFVIAILHTFLVKPIENFSHRFDENTFIRNFLHYMSEVEAVFGFWSLILIIGMILIHDVHFAFDYIDHINYSEPIFVFVIMFMAATRPIIAFSETLIFYISKILPFNSKMSFYITTLILGPLMGSFITEPGAMTVCSMILLKDIYKGETSLNFKYATIGLLFVNISIGGTLTHFAAPPVVMVASKWGWGISTMLKGIGYKAFLSILISTISVAFIFKNEFHGLLKLSQDTDKRKMELPIWIVVAHILFIALVVFSSHHLSFFFGVFLFFLGFLSMTKRYQFSPKLRESAMVGFFLAGLVTLGSLQQWWLQELILKLSDTALYLGATALTAVTDNAALTYLGSLVSLSESAKYFLVAGAVVGGGLTVIANAPNPVGYGILKDSFGHEGIRPLKLFWAALGPTIVALVLIGTLPNIG